MWRLSGWRGNEGEGDGREMHSAAGAWRLGIFDVLLCAAAGRAAMNENEKGNGYECTQCYKESEEGSGGVVLRGAAGGCVGAVRCERGGAVSAADGRGDV